VLTTNAVNGNQNVRELQKIGKRTSSFELGLPKGCLLMAKFAETRLTAL